MKKILWMVSIMLAISLIACGSDQTVKDDARKSSVQISTYIPGLRVSFVSSLPKDVPFDKALATKILDSRIKNLRESLKEEIRQEITQSKTNRYESSLTSITTFISETASKTDIPIGSLKGVPEWAHFPEKILAVYQTESTDINPYDKEAEKDISAISETTGVSISKAKEMLSKIRAEGYSISKESVKKGAEIKFLWFDDGWSDSYPVKLDWSVIVEGSKSNYLKGYDPRGILKTDPLPEGKKVFVSCGYLDLQDRFKPKSSEITILENEVKELENKRDELTEENETLRKDNIKKPKYQRDITKATMADVMYGIVKIERFWMETVGTGVYIGNDKLKDKRYGFPSRWYGSVYESIGKDYGFILTNAHVADDSIASRFYVSEDHEVMMFIGPGVPYVRYTDASDSLGSPAWVLNYDTQPILSRDYDSAIMVTQMVPGYDKNKAILGDSDKIKGGERICFAGNPSGLQKFLTTGVVSKASYSLADSKWGGYFLKWGGKLMTVKNIWYDAILGHGGSSGSGLFAMDGSQRDKVIGLHHAGLQTAVLVSEMKAETIIPKLDDSITDIVINSKWEGLIKNITLEQKKKLFVDFPFKDAELKAKSLIELKETNAPLVKMLTTQLMYVMIPMAGMNAAIPINPIKQYLQERGIDPDHFGFDGIDNWEQ